MNRFPKMLLLPLAYLTVLWINDLKTKSIKYNERLSLGLKMSTSCRLAYVRIFFKIISNVQVLSKFCQAILKLWYRIFQQMSNTISGKPNNSKYSYTFVKKIFSPLWYRIKVKPDRPILEKCSHNNHVKYLISLYRKHLSLIFHKSMLEMIKFFGTNLKELSTICGSISDYSWQNRNHIKQLRQIWNVGRTVHSARKC